MAEELIDICDENNKLTGQQGTKAQAHKGEFWHRGAHIWVYNSKGEILLQLRAKAKKLFPGLWDLSIGGHVSAGEDPLTTAVREAKEELGLEISNKDLDFIKIYKNEIIFGEVDNKEFYYVYFLKYDGSIDSLVLQLEEVEGAQFFPIEQLETELKNQPQKFVAHGDYWFDVIKEIKNKLNI